MPLPPSFLDELRARTTLSALVGGTVKLTRAGREHKGCCPFHDEKTASFTVSDEKGFYHCFGCGAHGDAIRWLTDRRGLAFMDAVRELAEAAGMDVPAPSAEAQARAARIEGIRPALAAAQALFRRELEANGAAREYLARRGVGAAAIDRFEIGWAPGRSGYVREIGVDYRAARAAGLVWESESGADGRRWGETFRARITVPVHDARGRIVGFGGRCLQPSETVAKYKNSPDSEIFDKGRTLFNLHRAAEAARRAKRLIVVEGYMDVIALDGAGIAEAVAPMGTALTEDQLERLWRIVDRPVLMMDGDAAGRKAALRACEAALPQMGPARTLSIAMLPDGRDPDDLVRDGGAAAIEAVLREAVSPARLLFDAAVARAKDGREALEPEAAAGVWARLEALAGTIRDPETGAQYLAAWRARYEREVSLAAGSGAPLPALHAEIAAEDGDYAWPEEQDESERRLIMIFRRALELRRQRREIGETLKDLFAMAKAIGFDGKALNAALRDAEADAGAREGHEAMWALYRRVLGIKGPMTEAMLPAPGEARSARAATAMQRRLSRTMALIDARGEPPPREGADG